MAEQIERLVTVWDANFQKLDEKLNKINARHHAVAKQIKKDADTFTKGLEQRYGAAGQAFGNIVNDSRLAVLDAGSSRLRVFGSALEPLGGMGLAAAAGIAALGVATQQTIAAMQFADEIDDAAQKLNIGTDALQEYRFAMTEVGGEAKDADAAIKDFNKVLGEAQSGLSPRAMKGFAALGFTKEQIQSFNSGEEALDEVARRVAALSKESERAAVAEKLGLGAMIPLMREGADEMEALRQKARDLGIVMDDELVAKGADANQQFETLSAVIKVQLTSAFVELSDEVVAFTGAIAEALSALNAFLERSGQLRRQTGLGAIDVARMATADGLARAGWTLARRAISGPRLDVTQDELNALAEPPPAPEVGGRLYPQGGRSRGRGRDTAEQRRRRQEQFERELERVQAELLRAYDHEFESISSDAGNKLLQLQQKHEAALREIVAAEEEYVRSKGLRGLTAAEAAQLRAAQEELRAYDEAQIRWEERRELEEYRLRLEEEAADAILDRLDVERDLAITSRDREAVERRILAATLKMERDRQKADLANDPNIDDDERARRLAGGDRDRQSRYDAAGRQSDGARMARDVVADIREPEDRLDAIAEMYAEIDRLRQDDVISEQEAVRAKAEADAMYREQRLASTMTMLDTLASLQNSSNKKLAAIGKAAAITQATIDGVLAVQKALASAPPPMNFIQAAIVGAVAAANVAQIAGMADGGRVMGAGGPREDNQLRWLSVGEHVINARDAARNRGLLDFINRGGDPGALIAGLNGASVAGAQAIGGAPITFSPTIDARGADVAAVARLEAVLSEQQRNFAANVKGVVARQRRFKLGGTA